MGNDERKLRGGWDLALLLINCPAFKPFASPIWRLGCWGHWVGLINHYSACSTGAQHEVRATPEDCPKSQNDEGFLLSYLELSSPPEEREIFSLKLQIRFSFSRFLFYSTPRRRGFDTMQDWLQISIPLSGFISAEISNSYFCISTERNIVQNSICAPFFIVSPTFHGKDLSEYRAYWTH